jgi:Skp family chaperone for outer membrane proteins
MKVFAVALALSLVLAASPSFAQAQAPAPAQPAGTKPAPAQPAPSTAKPAAPAPAAAAPQAPPRVPFQNGLKYAYVRLQEVASNSVQGKAYASKAEGLRAQKVKELQDKQKQLTAAQDKLDKSGTLLTDSARAGLQADIERLNKDIQRFTEDAQQEIEALTQQLQAEFEKLLLPVIDKVAREKQVHFVFDAVQSGLVWADPGMDLTLDVIAALDAGSAKPAAAGSIGPAVPVAK